MPYDYLRKVDYSDIDRRFSLSLAGAIRNMQEAAAMDSTRVGYGLLDIKKTRVVWAVVEWRVRLLEHCLWNSPITVRTWTKSVERAIGTRNFEIFDEKGKRVCIAESKWILVDVQTGRATHVTKEMAEIYALEDRAVFDAPVDAQPPAQRTLALSYTPMRRDIDTNSHVNNLVYLELAYQALPEDVWKNSFKDVTMRFFREVRFGDTIKCFYAQENGRHFVEILNAQETVRHALVIFG